MGSQRTTSRTAIALALAALLLAPPASAAKSAKLKTTDREAQRLVSAGVASLENGQMSEAISAFTKAARKDGSVSNYFLLGWAHYQRAFKLGTPEAADRDDAQSAIDAYATALGLDPSLAELPDASRLYFSIALCYEAVQSYDNALGAYKMAFRAAPSKVLIPMNAARLRLKMGDAAKAVLNIELAVKAAGKTDQIKALHDAVRRDPSFAALLADVPSRKALGLGPQEGDATVAALGAREEEMRDSVRDEAPKPVAPVQNAQVLEKLALGNVEFKFRRYLSAIGAYEEALALDQKSLTLGAQKTAQIYEKIGTSHKNLGQPDAAILALQKSLQQNPSDPAVRYQIASAYAMAGKTTLALNAVKESFKSCSDPNDLRRFMLLAKTDPEFESVRALPSFRSTVERYAGRAAAR